MTLTNKRAAEVEDVDQVTDTTATTVPLSHLPYSFNIHDAAKYIGVSERTLYYALAQGTIISHKVGKKHVIPRAELEAWVDANPTSQEG